MEEMHRARYGGGGGMVCTELPYSFWAPPSQHLLVFTNLEALQTPSFRVFNGGSIM